MTPSRAAGRPRKRATSLRVIWTDRLAGAAITSGGMFVIVAVVGILVYLAYVSLPLFSPARVQAETEFPLLSPDRTADLIHVGLDEYKVAGFYLLRSGELASFAAKTGQVVSTERVFPEGAQLRAHSQVSPDGHVALGFQDGGILLLQVAFETRFIDKAEAHGTTLDSLEPGMTVVSDGAVIERTGQGDLRKVSVVVARTESIVAPGTAGVQISKLDFRKRDSSERLALLKANGEMYVNEISHRESMLTGEVFTDLAKHPVPLAEDLEREGVPAHMLLTTTGDQLYLAWRSGLTVRYDLRDPLQPVMAEVADLTPDTEAELAVLTFMTGEQSIISGDSTGIVRAWSKLPKPGGGPDESVLVPTHTLKLHETEVKAIGVATRVKTIAAGAGDGRFALVHMTSERLLAGDSIGRPSAIATIQITPKGDGLFALAADGRLSILDVDCEHPEMTLRSIVGKVWYEGYPRPEYTWQSSSGTDDFEPKLSLIPLIFGTLKATCYSMLFATPVALLAAIFTSEFLDRRYRKLLKPAIEMMASLPSVVLGFIAALVLAPIADRGVVGILVAIAVVPAGVLGAGYLWQLLPSSSAGRLGSLRQVGLTLLLIAALLAATALAAPAIEARVFAGDFHAWLDGRVGSAVPSIAMILWPVIFFAFILADIKLLSPALGRRTRSLTRTRALAIDLAKYAVLVITSVLLTAGIAMVAAATGLDLRGVLFGTYVQRNAFVVGFVMGFAVIPIIYTIAEDALSSVPQTVRSASLGCGATPWQTASRVVLPVAAPGIFAALMVGLGRAVGETMIVLMAAGNTPILEWNIFSGLRTLSANIAVELPEAVKDGTLYRMLFLSALTLFVMTFAVNTMAELIRQRFRKRTSQL